MAEASYAEKFADWCKGWTDQPVFWDSSNSMITLWTDETVSTPVMVSVPEELLASYVEKLRPTETEDQIFAELRIDLDGVIYVSEAAPKLVRFDGEVFEVIQP